MLNNVQKKLGYREVVYNARSKKFYTFVEGDNYEDLNVNLDNGEGDGEDTLTTATLALANPSTFALEGAGNLATQQDLNIYFAENIATKTSELTNDAGFITAADVPDAPDVNLDGYATESWVESKGYITLAEVPPVDAYTKAESDARYLAVNISSLSELPTV